MRKDEGAEYSALLTHLSKIFDCFPNDLIIAKFNAHGFDRHIETRTQPFKRKVSISKTKQFK